MSLDFYFDAVELLNKAGYPFVLLCSPKGAEEAQISFSEDVLDDLEAATGVMDSIDVVYELLYQIHEEELNEEEDDEEED